MWEGFLYYIKYSSLAETNPNQPVFHRWLYSVVSINSLGHNNCAESRHITKNAPKAIFFFLNGTHHHILKGFGDNKRHAPVGKDAHSTGNSPHFDGENLWHDQPWDWTPTKSKTWTQKQDFSCDMIHFILKSTIFVLVD